MLAAKITIANDLKTNLTTKIANMHNVQVDYCFIRADKRETRLHATTNTVKERRFNRFFCEICSINLPTKI